MYEILVGLLQIIFIISSFSWTFSDTVFIIYSPAYRPDSGGIRTLHNLVHFMNSFSSNPIAYISFINKKIPSLNDEDLLRIYHTKFINPKLNTPVATSNMLSDCIVIYPEIVSGNPLKATNVIKWILYFPGLNGGDSADEYSKDWLIACYSNGICNEFNRNVFTIVPLKLIDYDLKAANTSCLSPGSSLRNGTTVFNGKKLWGHLKWQDISLPSMFSNVTYLSRKYPSKEVRDDLFCKSRYCVSYDMATWVSVEAALAGCISIVLPQPNVTKKEWLDTAYGFDELKYGIAFGVDDIPHAVKTLQLVRNNLIEQERLQSERVKKFLKDSIEFFNSHSKIVNVNIPPF